MSTIDCEYIRRVDNINGDPYSTRQLVNTLTDGQFLGTDGETGTISNIINIEKPKTFNSWLWIPR